MKDYYPDCPFCDLKGGPPTSEEIEHHCQGTNELKRVWYDHSYMIINKGSEYSMPWTEPRHYICGNGHRWSTNSESKSTGSSKELNPGFQRLFWHDLN